jgi:hypothetical protein
VFWFCFIVLLHRPDSRPVVPSIWAQGVPPGGRAGGTPAGLLDGQPVWAAGRAAERAMGQAGGERARGGWASGGPAAVGARAAAHEQM